MMKIITTVAMVVILSASAMAESVSAYLIAAGSTTATVENKLKSSGFDVLATNNNVITITNKELQATNTYVATLQVYVGSSDVRVQNPAYFGAAYLDSNYKKGQFEGTVSALTEALGRLEGSPEHLEAEELGGYHFMMGMPYFDEPISVKKADKVYKKVNGNKKILYSLSLPNGSLLVGHKLSSNTKDFLEVLGESSNGQVLPYEALVFSNEVKIMNPKFYLALSLPQLSMGQFMKISDIPDKIEDEISSAYK